MSEQANIRSANEAIVAADIIRQHCMGRACEGCVFKARNDEKYRCRLMNDTPSQWVLPKSENHGGINLKKDIEAPKKDIDMKKVRADWEAYLPVPCDCTGVNTHHDWFAKLLEEVGEVSSAIADLYDADNDTERHCKEHLAEELTDVITVCTSFLDWLGYNKKARILKQAEVNLKNAKRGYFEWSDC